METLREAGVYIRGIDQPGAINHAVADSRMFCKCSRLPGRPPAGRITSARWPDRLGGQEHMRTCNLPDLRVALERIGQRMIGPRPHSDEVSRVLMVPGASVATRFGLPETIVAVCDILFRGLPWDEARATVLALPEAIARDGRDLRPVVWLLLAEEVAMLRSCLDCSPVHLFWQRLAFAVERGLVDVAGRRSWSGGLDVLEELPSDRTPAPNDEMAQIHRRAGRALRAATKAIFWSDTMLVATIRHRAARARDIEFIEATRRKAREGVLDSVQQALVHSIEVGVAVAGMSAGEGMRPRAEADARLTAVRRQAETLLRLVRTV